VAAQKICTIRERISRSIGESRFNAWFGEATTFHLQDDGLCVMVPNTFVGQWITANYLGELRTVARDIVGEHASVAVRVMPGVDGVARGAARPTADTAGEGAEPARAARPRLRGELSTFVVGPSNQLAYSTAQALLRNPRQAFRPLFVHGGCGLGKTHLLQGICNGVALGHPTLRWCYLSGEEFTNEFIFAVKSGRVDAFRARFRRADVLVIDDIHFLANKRATQEEFLHTFNAIDGSGRTVVLSSDRHPRSIAMLAEPLISRLIAGMVVEIEPPDYTVRREILRQRASAMNTTVPDAVLDLVARHVSRNVRELEGALYKLVAVAALTKEPVTPELAASALQDYFVTDTGPLQPADVAQTVANYFNVARERVSSHSRDHTVTLARSLAMYLIRRHCGRSFPEIGRCLGHKNHSTVVMATQRIDAQITQDASASWKTPDGRITRPLREVLAELEGLIEQRRR
jgi:chromosomal replication initiator protein